VKEDFVSGTDPGLRAEKRRQTHALILANAIALFREKGIRGTRSREIARSSRVSPATLFNYFPTKNHLAEAWVRGEIHLLLDEVAAAAGDHGLRSGMRASCRRLAESSCAEPVLRLEAWQATPRAMTPAVGPTDRLTAVLRREQERDRLRGDISAAALAVMLSDALEVGLIDALREPIDDVREVTRRLRAGVDLVLDGARKRNERVTAPVARASDS
jgi:AcrR family transcriptional regulator